MELTKPSATAKAPAERFTGDVYVTPIKQKAEPSRLIAISCDSPPAHAPTAPAWSCPATAPLSV